MSDVKVSENPWKKEAFLVPLTVGIIVAAFAISIPWLLSNKLELSYEIDGPTRYLNDPALKTIEVKVGDEIVKDIVSYRVRLWNSGGKPIKNLPVTIVVESDNPSDKIFALIHETSPKYEFGKITDLETTPTMRRFQYELLNSNDGDVVTLLTNYVAPLGFYAKSEGVGIVRRKSNKENPWSWWLAGIALGGLSSVIANFFLAIRKKRKSDLKAFVAGMIRNQAV